MRKDTTQPTFFEHVKRMGYTALGLVLGVVFLITLWNGPPVTLMMLFDERVRSAQGTLTTTYLRNATVREEARAQQWAVAETVLIWIGVLLLAILALIIVYAIYNIVQQRFVWMAPRNGAFPIRFQNTASFKDRLAGRPQFTVINPNLSQDAIGVHSLGTDKQLTSASAGSRDSALATELLRGQQRNLLLQATPNGHKISTGAAKLLSGVFVPKPPKELAPPPPVEIKDPVRQISLEEVVAKNFANRPKMQIYIGQSAEDGLFASWNIRASQQIAILGANGTGKTSSVGAMIALTLAMWKIRTFIFDPKGGADWSTFNNFVTRRDSDYEQLPSQLDLIWQEIQRRKELLMKHNCPNIWSLPVEIRPEPFALILEELGETRESARIAGGTYLNDIDARMIRMMQLSRFTGLIIALIDQRPRDWPKVVQANIKTLITFKQGMNQGSAVGYYHADKLADVGEFAYMGRRYWSWETLPHVPNFLNNQMAFNVVKPKLLE